MSCGCCFLIYQIIRVRLFTPIYRGKQSALTYIGKHFIYGCLFGDIYSTYVQMRCVMKLFSYENFYTHMKIMGTQTLQAITPLFFFHFKK